MTAAKREQRRTARAIRARQDPAWGADLCRHVLASGLVPPGAVVAGFWPLAQEIDIRPLLGALAGRGHAVVLPVTLAPGQPLGFARWRPGDAMVAEPFGTMRPLGEPLVPDLLFVPLLAFDAHCRRLGYGGGYYDRTLAGLPGRMAIGCAFAAQQVDCVAAEAHDMPLDAVATERGILFPVGA